MLKANEQLIFMIQREWYQFLHLQLSFVAVDHHVLWAKLILPSWVNMRWSAPDMISVYLELGTDKQVVGFSRLRYEPFISLETQIALQFREMKAQTQTPGQTEVGLGYTRSISCWSITPSLNPVSWSCKLTYPLTKSERYERPGIHRYETWRTTFAAMKVCNCILHVYRCDDHRPCKIDWLFTVLRPAQEYFTYMETSPLPLKVGRIKAYARLSGPLSREGSLSCHICCDTGPRFFRSHPKDRPIQSPLTTHKGCGGPILLTGTSWHQKRLQKSLDQIICRVSLWERCLPYADDIGI
jgi:hypothetical protein